MSIIEGVVVVDLRHTTSMSEEEMNLLSFLPLKVVSGDMTGQEVHDALVNFTVPSEIEDGDYKDYAVEAANNTLMLVEALEGTGIIQFSEGPRNWFVSYTYKGEEYRIGIV